ncbi:hypothetical protein BSKO_03459 [Bryopsis sp. KO-2023]|nr:hypothetical protein BSKO_03459 [Bryopsis sp. KO-2023]
MRINRELLARLEEKAVARFAQPVNPLEGHLRYEMVRELGSGAQGCVFLALDKQTDEHVAIKCLPRGTQMSDKVERELLNHRKFWHAHVIQFYEVFLTDKNVCIVMEYAPGGSLREFLKTHSLTEDGARLYFQQLIFAVNYCHHMGVANRDIKLDNTLLSDDQRLLKLCDFGLSKDVTSLCRTQVGTPNYLPPEIIQIPRGGTYDGKQSDVWCCGVMLYTMLCGCFPFERREDRDLPVNQILEKLMERIVNADWQFPAHTKLSNECLDLLKRILNPDPKARLTIKGIQMHPWYNIGLPPGAAQHDFPKRPEDDGLQSIGSIVDIVQRAKMEGCE